jgi:protein TonB
MTLDGGGEVSRVEILDANPRRVFDRSVVRALSQWKFTPGSAGRSVEVEIGFSL